MPALFIEDGDPSYGHRSVNNLPANTRFFRRVEIHEHPPQSLDLNPIEGVWLILKERLRTTYSYQLHEIDYWQLKKAIKTTWDGITLSEIRARIAEMP